MNTRILALFPFLLLLACKPNTISEKVYSHSANVDNNTSTDSTHANPGNAMTPKMRDSLAKNPSMFVQLANKQLKWEVPAEPAHIAGPIYFVGTTGLSSFLITTSKGHILLYTGLSSSGPMIEQSIKKLGFNPADIKILLTGHAHVDHVGGHAYVKKISGAQVAVMEAEKELIESGGKSDFHYGSYPEFMFDPVQVDRILHDGDHVSLGDITMTALHTGGHTRGATTWTMTIVDGGKTYSVVFPDGTSINPGYRLAVNPSYPGIEVSYRNTLAILERLNPDIWLSCHTDFFNYKEKHSAAASKGADAYIDPEGYQQRIANEKAHLEAEIKNESVEKE